jgi:transcriptional/translational regulatory protein YebC/TACO1
MNSVNFKFDTKARLSLQSVIDEDALMELCLECGVDDYDLKYDYALYIYICIYNCDLRSDYAQYF